MQLPTIHDNGSPKSMLTDTLCVASTALTEAVDAMKRCGPNGRDYYPQGPDALNKAVTEHMDRMRRVDAVRQEIDTLILAIDTL